MAVNETKNGKWRVRAELSMMVGSLEEANRLDRLASSAIDNVRRRFERGDQPCRSIREIMDDFLDHQQVWRSNASITTSGYRRRLKMFALAFGDRPLDRISREDLHAWITERLGNKGNRRRHHPGESVSRDTVNNDLKALRRFCEWASEVGHCPPGIEITTVPLLRVKGKCHGNRFPPRSLVRQNFMSVLRRIEKASPQIGLVLRAMLLLGARPEAIFSLRWRNVQMPRGGIGSVSLPPLKGGSEGSIPIVPGSHKAALFLAARAVFRRYHGRDRAENPVFCTRRGRSSRRALGWTTDSFDHQLAQLCARLGIEGFSAYTARHSAVTWLQQQPGVSPAAVQAYARHLRVSTQEAYSHRSGADGHPAYAAMEGILGRHARNPEGASSQGMVTALEGIEQAMDCDE